MKRTFTYKQRIIRKMPHSVIRVLIENKLFEAYMRHIVDCMELASIVTYEPSYYILKGFKWSTTPEGWHKWNEIYLKIKKLQ